MKRPQPTSIVPAALAFFVVLSAEARAGTPAASPDDMCAPTADPCMIDDVYDIAPPGNFDFGLRTVSVTTSGRFIGSIDILCGAFEVTANTNQIVSDIQEPGEAGGTFSITARRACAGDGVTPCLRDDTCAQASLGDCSVGTGTIDFDGEVQGNGDPGGTAIFRAAGDISIADTIRLSGADFGTDGGFLDIESTMGSVTITGQLKANSGTSTYDYNTYGGEMTLSADQDLTLAKKVELLGGATAGSIELFAGGDVVVRDDILADAGQVVYAYGGAVLVGATENIVIDEPVGSGDTLLTVNGGQALSYDGLAPGSAGCLSFYAGEDLTLHDRSIVSGVGGRGGFAGESLGANVYLYAETGLLTMDGDIHAHGRGAGGHLGRIYAYGLTGINVGKKAFFDVKAHYSGYVDMKTPANITIKGTIRAEGELQGGGYYSYPGYGGSIYVVGADAVIDGGKLLNGADAGSGGITLDVCRLAMINNARIDGTHGSNFDGDNASNYFIIGESMSVEAGSKIFADDKSGAENVIDYRDANKPPVLDGTIDPPPVLSNDPGIDGCPICGNSEIDQFESCDDGNTLSGDGCRDDCQDEGCIAETPGYPGTSLCDDADGCTVDSCDPVAHSCSHELNCEEGVACTVDACVASACEHTPSDALCDDGNDCTDDVCSATTGCVYANLTGSACEDGDLCTVTGTCDAGTCIATDESLTHANNIKAKLKPASDDDQLKAKLRMPLSDFSADVTVTGMILELRDAADATILAAILEAGDWEDATGGGTLYKFRDSQGAGGPANGVDRARIKVNTSKQEAAVVLRMRGTEIPGAAGQTAMSMSLLFGTDPGDDDCLSARSIPCKAKATSTSCKD